MTSERLLVLRDLEGLSYLDIMKITGLPEGTVKSRLHPSPRGADQGVSGIRRRKPQMSTADGDVDSRLTRNDWIPGVSNNSNRISMKLKYKSFLTRLQGVNC